MSLVLFKLPIHPRLSLGTFVGNVNYITAVIDGIQNPLAVSRKVSTRGNLLRFDDDADRSQKTIYEIKCDRLNADGRDSEVATIGRDLMQRRIKAVHQDLIELPNTLGAMFIAEVNRLPLMLPLGLMLLDLIEAKVHYGKGEAKPYTWKKMMSFAKGGENSLEESKLVGGKHPMMHENSIKQAKVFSSAFNQVTMRSVSVLVAWLHMYLRSEDSNWQTEVVSESREALENKPIKQLSLGQFGENLARDSSSIPPRGTRGTGKGTLGSDRVSS